MPRRGPLLTRVQRIARFLARRVEFNEQAKGRKTVKQQRRSTGALAGPRHAAQLHAAHAMWGRNGCQEARLQTCLRSLPLRTLAPHSMLCTARRCSRLPSNSAPATARGSHTPPLPPPLPSPSSLLLKPSE